ncbi:hypothetical protein [Haloarcula onubensis]|uniref:MBL fold metallo-hydrolase n=1 Tax=Haloarcula onubensis TaxID=2950539 RepID=A0ABU2FRI3_9EURY|nr:hypothetical protein [Halomicroarcula sp. S3CR25-11]MDS0283380.1 hypothetical protein [Halomicroarcula sp. S3CR25-11]
MPMYRREESADYRVVDRWHRGVGWRARPDEDGQRTSHAFRAPDGGVWLVDPLDAPGVEAVYADLGEVVGVAVLADYHARDAGVFAKRHGVPVTVPTGLDRAAEMVDAPVRRVTDSLAGFDLRRVSPLGAWTETVAYRERDATLYVPDVLSSGPAFTVGDERLGLNVLARLAPPRAAFAGVDPNRVLLGHGTGLFGDASEALGESLRNARRRLPRAMASTVPRELRAMVGAVR